MAVWESTPGRAARTGLTAVALASLWGCASTGTGVATRTVAPDQACAQLNSLNIPAAAIALPTGGATVTSAELVAAKADGPTPAGQYCKVLASIHPVDPAAPKLNFQLDLPTEWNGKALMLGGGGYNGTVRDPAAHVPHGAPDKPTPLGRGYATWNSDSGHQAAAPYAGAHASLDGRFGTNQESVRNFTGEFIKKTRDAAMHLISQRYGAMPGKTYFAGGSTGGREAFIAVQRYPQDFDGAIAFYPAWNAATLNLHFGRTARALAAPGAYLSVAKRNMLYNAIIASCDGLDGAQDGIVSNKAACKFDPQTVRCPNGGDLGDQCLSDAQITALNTYSTPTRLTYPLGSGETAYPGFDAWSGIDLAGINPVASLLTWNTDAPRHPPTLNMPYFAQFWDMWVRYFLNGGNDIDALQVDPLNPGALQPRIQYFTGLQDVNKTDLSEFERRGGKLLIAHGTVDALVNERATTEYFQRLNATMGADRVAAFARYYQIPGFGHVFGKAYGASWDALGALENWRERGVAPRDQVTVDVNAATKGRSRPLCEFPAWPKYKGSGDLNSAQSFSCVTQ
jgi:hypothetical protein